jgi:hypothetical protein
MCCDRSTCSNARACWRSASRRLVSELNKSLLPQGLPQARWARLHSSEELARGDRPAPPPALAGRTSALEPLGARTVAPADPLWPREGDGPIRGRSGRQHLRRRHHPGGTHVHRTSPWTIIAFEAPLFRNLYHDYQLQARNLGEPVDQVQRYIGSPEPGRLARPGHRPAHPAPPAQPQLESPPQDPRGTARTMPCATWSKHALDILKERRLDRMIREEAGTLKTADEMNALIAVLQEINPIQRSEVALAASARDGWWWPSPLSSRISSARGAPPSAIWSRAWHTAMCASGAHALGLAFFINLTFTLVEVVGGLVDGQHRRAHGCLARCGRLPGARHRMVPAAAWRCGAAMRTTAMATGATVCSVDGSRAWCSSSARW